MVRSAPAVRTAVSDAGTTEFRRSLADRPAPALAASGPQPTGPRRETSRIQLTDATDLAALPRFAMLKGLMERLTGREVMLIPPGTIILGTRNAPDPASYVPDLVTPEVHLMSVDAVEDGRAFRVSATYVAPGGVLVAAQIDVERQVVDLHAAGRPSGRQEPLRIEVDKSAHEPAPDRPMRVAVVGADTVRVTVDRPHHDLEA